MKINLQQIYELSQKARSHTYNYNWKNVLGYDLAQPYTHVVSYSILLRAFEAEQDLPEQYHSTNLEIGCQNVGCNSILLWMESTW